MPRYRYTVYGRAECCFEIKTLGRVYTFLTASIELATEWVEGIKMSNKKAYQYDLDIVSTVVRGYVCIEVQKIPARKNYFERRSTVFQPAKPTLLFHKYGSG